VARTSLARGFGPRGAERPSASTTVAPQRRNQSTTVDFPAAMFSCQRDVEHLEQRPSDLHLVWETRWQCRHLASYDSRPPTMIVGESHLAGFAVDQALIPRSRGPPADDAGWPGNLSTTSATHMSVGIAAERQPSKIHVGAGEDDAHAAVGQSVGHRDDAFVEEIGLRPRRLLLCPGGGCGGSPRSSRPGSASTVRAVMGGYGNRGRPVAGIQMGLKDLHRLAGDHGRERTRRINSSDLPEKHDARK